MIRIKMALNGMIPKFGGNGELIELQRWNNWMMAGLLLIFLGILIVLIVGVVRWTPNHFDQKFSQHSRKSPGIQNRNHQKLTVEGDYEEEDYVEDIQTNNKIR